MTDSVRLTHPDNAVGVEPLLYVYVQWIQTSSCGPCTPSPGVDAEITKEAGAQKYRKIKVKILKVHKKPVITEKLQQ